MNPDDFYYEPAIEYAYEIALTKSLPIDKDQFALFLKDAFLEGIRYEKKKQNETRVDPQAGRLE